MGILYQGPVLILAGVMETFVHEEAEMFLMSIDSARRVV
jgi:hypothetical protein